MQTNGTLRTALHEEQHQRQLQQPGFMIKRPRHYSKPLQDWEPEITAGCHGKALFFDKREDAQEVVDLLNKAHIGLWQIEMVEVAPECGICDNYELYKYKSNLQECVTQDSWQG